MRRIPPGISKLDAVLSGGIPEHALAMLCGIPGSGKTMLTFQVLFGLARAGHRSIYFSTLAEPYGKLTAYLGELSFYDAQYLGGLVQWFDLGPAARGGLAEALNVVVRQVQEQQPLLVAIDSFKVLSELAGDRAVLRNFLHELSYQLPTLDCTSVLVGEYSLADVSSLPEFAAADMVLSLQARVEVLPSGWSLRVLKLRGSRYDGDEHPYALSDEGLILQAALGPGRSKVGS